MMPKLVSCRRILHITKFGCQLEKSLAISRLQVLYTDPELGVRVGGGWSWHISFFLSDIDLLLITGNKER